MRVVVFGAGSLGSLIGGLLTDVAEVTLVGRPEHMRAVAADGLQIEGLERRVTHPACLSSYPSSESFDCCLVTVKAYDTAEAARSIRANAPPIVVSVQNGLGNEAILEESLPEATTVLAGTATYGARLERPGVVSLTGRGVIRVGSPVGGRSAVAESLEERFRESDLRLEADPAMPTRLWEKTAINAGINPVTALARVSNGALTHEPLRTIATGAAREVAMVANEQGIALNPDALAERTVEVAETTRENTSSMARDVEHGHRTEIEAITGAVLARADQTATPINLTLASLIAGWERARGLRENTGVP